MAKKATINMVAERAGVSRATVDRVLNGRPYVKQEAYDKVIAAMKDLHYVPPRAEQIREMGLTYLTTGKECKIGVLLPEERGYFITEIMNGINRASAELAEEGVEVIVDKCETELPYEVIEKIDGLVSQGVQGIALSAKDYPSIVEKINQTVDSGIAVVTFNSDIEDSGRLCFVGQQLEKSGRVAADLMSKFLSPGDRLLIAVGNREYDGHRKRMNGFIDKLLEQGCREEDFRLIETYNDYQRTYRKVLDVLRENPDIKGIYMANRSVTGCTEAVRDAGKKGEIHIIGHDLTQSTKRLLQSGEIDFVIAQNLFRQSYQAIGILQQYIQNGIRPDPETERLPIEIICLENMEEELPFGI